MAQWFFPINQCGGFHCLFVILSTSTRQRCKEKQLFSLPGFEQLIFLKFL
jgi:hypothetical protein